MGHEGYKRTRGMRERGRSEHANPFARDNHETEDADYSQRGDDYRSVVPLLWIWFCEEVDRSSGSPRGAAEEKI